jgi:hypothetical protein
MGLGARLFNIFATPGEVFDQVKSGKPSLANWLLPTLLACLVGVIHVVVMFSQPAIVQQVIELQEKAIQDKVKVANMPPEQADAALKAMEQYMGPTIMKIGGSVGVVFTTFGWLFGVALAVWLIGAKLCKGPFDYMQAVEITGLTTMIAVLGSIITTFLVMARGSMFANPGPFLFINEFDPANKVHLILASLNLAIFWYIAVLALGLSKLSGMSYGKAALWLFGLWAGFRLLVVFTGMGASGM